jgi:tRNA(Ile)-lysidine synthase
MPLLKGENPSLALNLSAMARRLRQDEQCLGEMAAQLDATDVAAMRTAHPALRRRALDAFLKANGMPEPNASHIAQAESLVFSDKPSAFARFPGGLILRRSYGKLTACREESVLEQVSLNPGESVALSTGITVRCEAADGGENTPYSFCVCAEGPVTIRPRQAGDEITLPGGTKSLKKLFIDRKIPAHERPLIPVAADGRGVIGICGIGANLARTEGDRKMRISFVISGENAE